ALHQEPAIVEGVAGRKVGRTYQRSGGNRRRLAKTEEADWLRHGGASEIPSVDRPEPEVTRDEEKLPSLWVPDGKVSSVPGNLNRRSRNRLTLEGAHVNLCSAAFIRHITDPPPIRRKTNSIGPCFLFLQ